MLNISILMGRLTAEPELRHTNSGIPVTSFTIAVERSYTKDSERITDFINIVAWRQTAEFVCKYFHKGQLLAINGSLQVRDYVDRENNKRRAYEVVADNVHFAEPKRDSYGGGNAKYSDQDAPPGPGTDDNQTQTAPSFSSGDTGGFEVFEGADDDLPF